MLAKLRISSRVRIFIRGITFLRSLRRPSYAHLAEGLQWMAIRQMLCLTQPSDIPRWKAYNVLLSCKTPDIESISSEELKTLFLFSKHGKTVLEKQIGAKAQSVLIARLSPKEESDPTHN